MSQSNGRPHSRSLLDLAPPDVRAHLEHDDTILIPLGACEMHGDHMPLGTDIYNAMEVSRRAAEKADTLVAPPIWSGYSPHHLREPERGMGTITMRSQTLLAIIHDTARSLIHHGFNRLIFVNGHTSNTKVTDPVFRNLRYETGALVAMFKPYGERYLGLIEDLMENPRGDAGLACERAGDLDHARLPRSERAHGAGGRDASGVARLDARRLRQGGRHAGCRVQGL